MTAATNPQRISDINVTALLCDPPRKRAAVTPMFDVMAPCYDAFTTLFSFGMHGQWKRAAVHTVERHCAREALLSPQILDVASGTGDLANEIARRMNNANVTTVDASREMVRVAVMQLRQRDGAPIACTARVRPSVGDMRALALRSGSMDVVMAGFGVCHVPDPNVAVREMRRVLRDGGQLVLLDFYRPETVWRRNVFLRYLAFAGSTVGWIWHRDPMVYGYIAHRIAHFLSWQQCQTMLERHGFRVDAVTTYVGGGIAQHTATAV